jgi:hypothetical protein
MSPLSAGFSGWDSAATLIKVRSVICRLAPMPQNNRARDETVLQFHGIGPYDIDYVNPSDDPSKRLTGK